MPFLTFLNGLVLYGILSSESVEEVLRMKMQAMLLGYCCAIWGYAESSVEEDVSPTRTGEFDESGSGGAKGTSERTEFATRERLEELE